MRFLIASTLIASSVICNAKPVKKIKQNNTPVSILVADEYGNIISKSNENKIKPIASISKLMVAHLASFQDLNELLFIPAERTVSTSIPKHITFLSRKELLELALIKSDNFAAEILCNNISNCVSEMNRVAKELNMNSTNFVEPTGLSKENVSSAEDLLKLILELSTNAVITNIASVPEIVIDNSLPIKNTNPLTFKYNTVLSKTGYTRPAGGCIVMMVNVDSSRRIFILLGSKNTKTRILELDKLISKYVN